MQTISILPEFPVFYAIPKIAIISFLLMMPPYAFAQNGRISGKIQTANGAPALFAGISIDDTTKRQYPDSNGVYIIGNIPYGHHSLKVVTAGKIVQERDVSINNDAELIIDFKLQSLDYHQINDVMITAGNNLVAFKSSGSLRLNSDLLEVPQSIQITTQQNIKEQGLLTTNDVLSTTAGSMAFYSSGQDVGMMLRGTSSQYNLLRNGIGAGYFYNQELDAAMIERVEFVMGPAGFMISNTDPGGLVNIVTKQPQHQQMQHFNLSYGSWNLMRATIDLGGEFKKGSRLTYRINAGIHHQQQFYRYGYLTKYFFATALKYELNRNTDFTFEYNFTHGKSLNDHLCLPTINGHFFELPSSFNIADPNVGGIATHDHYFRLDFNHTFNSNWSLNALAGVVLGAWKANAMNMNGDASVTSDTIYRYLYKDDYYNNLYTANIVLKGNFCTGKHICHSLLTGLDFGISKLSDKYDQQYGQQSGLYYPSPVYNLSKASATFTFVDPYVSTQRSDYSAIYIQDHIKFYNSFFLTLAARITRTISFNSNQGEEHQKDLKLTPRLGFTYLIHKSMAAYLVYDQAFLPQMGKSFDGATFAPMKGCNKEIGWKSYWFNNTLSTTIALYHTIRNNIMISDPVHQGFYMAEGQIVAKGLELNINGQLSKNIDIAANYAHTNVQVTKSVDSTKPQGMYSFGSPVHNTANVFLGYKFINGPLKGILFGAAFHHADKFNSSYTENDFVGGYNLMDASAAYSHGKFSIQLNLYNLANAKYITYAYKYTPTDWAYTPGAPRNFRIEVGYQF